MLAPITGGMSAAALLLLGTAAAATNFAIDERRYLALAEASKSQAKPGTALVERSEVLAAQATAESEGIALALALVTSVAAAPEILKAMRNAWRQRLINRVGDPSTVLTGTAADPLGPRDFEPPYLQPPGMQVIRPGNPLALQGLDPGKRYLWVVDTEGNFNIAPEAQGDFYAWRTRSTKVNTRSVAKHGDLVPSADNTTRAPARAGGELVAERGPNGQPTGRWVMNNDSGYTFFRADGKPSGAANLSAARDLLAASGTDASKIVMYNNAG